MDDIDGQGEFHNIIWLPPRVSYGKWINSCTVESFGALSSELRWRNFFTIKSAASTVVHRLARLVVLANGRSEGTRN